MGFVTHLCAGREELDRKADEMARQIAALPPLAVQGTKEVLLDGRDGGVYPGLKYVAQKNAAQIPSDDMIEAIAAFMEKRDPRFTGH